MQNASIPSGFTTVWRENQACTAMCGFTVDQVDNGARKLGVHPTALFAVLTVAHMNLTEEQMPCILCPYIHEKRVTDTYIFILFITSTLL